MQGMIAQHSFRTLSHVTWRTTTTTRSVAIHFLFSFSFAFESRLGGAKVSVRVGLLGEPVETAAGLLQRLRTVMEHQARRGSELVIVRSVLYKSVVCSSSTCTSPLFTCKGRAPLREFPSGDSP